MGGVLGDALFDDGRIRDVFSIRRQFEVVLGSRVSSLVHGWVGLVVPSGSASSVSGGEDSDGLGWWHF